jgi:hypothetical protein
MQYAFYKQVRILLKILEHLGDLGMIILFSLLRCVCNFSQHVISRMKLLLVPPLLAIIIWNLNFFKTNLNHSAFFIPVSFGDNPSSRVS